VRTELIRQDSQNLGRDSRRVLKLRMEIVREWNHNIRRCGQLMEIVLRCRISRVLRSVDPAALVVLTTLPCFERDHIVRYLNLYNFEACLTGEW
jgi:hypothetical protein